MAASGAPLAVAVTSGLLATDAGAGGWPTAGSRVASGAAGVAGALASSAWLGAVLTLVAGARVTIRMSGVAVGVAVKNKLGLGTVDTFGVGVTSAP